MKGILSVVALSLFSILLFNSCEPGSGGTSKRKGSHEAPTLVVGIVVDQMRPDYIHRYWDKFGDDGFKRLVNDGFTFTNAHFGYYTTFTGPGHASVYTGSTPSVHGILSNSVNARGYQGVGTHPDNKESIGPRSLLTTTVGDELRLHTNNRSRVVSISLKDRGAVLPGGHTGDAYWYESKTGNFVTSTYYMDTLPTWMQEFNDRNLPEQYTSTPWETLLPIEAYIESIADDNPYEAKRGKDRPVFPHSMLGPFGDNLLTELAISAIEGESLGSRATTDMLAISFSAPDGIGHGFAPASVEVQDTYLRLDQNIAQLLDYLEKTFEKENILLFLTADHGAVHNVQYLVDQGIRGGYVDKSAHENALRAHLKKTYGEDFVARHGNYGISLDHDAIRRKNLDVAEIQKEVAHFMMTQEGVAGALTAETLMNNEFTYGVRERVQLSFHPKRSGDVMIWFEPQWSSARRKVGTGHGSPWEYDNHAPMLWYGWNIPAGESAAPVFVTDIAPTVATYLHSPFPSGTTGNPLNDYMR